MTVSSETLRSISTPDHHRPEAALGDVGWEGGTIDTAAEQYGNKP